MSVKNLKESDKKPALPRRMSDKFDTKRLGAVKLLAEGFTQGEAAQKLGVSRRTLERWLAAPELREAIADVKSELRDATVQLSVEQIRGRIDTIAPLAIDTVEEILRDKFQPASDRLRAAIIAASWAGFKFLDVNTSISYLHSLGYTIITAPEDIEIQSSKEDGHGETI
jgi:transposase